MEDNQLRTASPEPQGDSRTLEGPAPDPARTSPADADRIPDMRHRRGSLGPPLAAAPLGDTASSAALHAHLAHLLDVRRDAPAERAATAEPGLGPHEDIERQPDGIPHLVIGLTALFSVLFAIALIGILISGPTLGSITAAILAIAAIPVVVFALGAKAERDRDHVHPSR